MARAALAALVAVVLAMPKAETALPMVEAVVAVLAKALEMAEMVAPTEAEVALAMELQLERAAVKAVRAVLTARSAQTVLSLMRILCISSSKPLS
jgi:hypothetical protein